MNLRQIEAFKCVMEHGSVTRAAEVMHVSQPAVTKLLQGLERSAGFRMFDRTHGRLVPTPEGVLLYRDVDRVFAAADEIRRSAQDILNMRTGTLSVGAMPALSSGFAQRVARTFMRSHPGVSLEIVSAPRMKLLDSLLSGKLDVAFCHSVAEHPEIETEPFAREAAVCILPPGHRLAAKRTVTARDLDGEPFISWGLGTLSRARVDALFDRAGVQRSLLFSATTSPAICAYVANGLGSAILHPLYVGIAAAAVVVRRFSPRLDGELLLAFPKRRNQPRLVKTFAAVAVREAQAMARSMRG